MSSKDSGKGARIGLACNACRSKKHRCSGEKPQCAQCASMNITCTWPIQQKRGPPKHYTNSLEARLLETEAVLLSLLSHVTIEQLRASFQSLPPTGRAFQNLNYEAEQSMEHLALLKQDVLRPAYWSSFPLDSEENVRRWWKDRTSRSSAEQSRNDFTPIPVLQEVSEMDTPSSGLPEPGATILNDSDLPSHLNLTRTERTYSDLTGIGIQASSIPLERGSASNRPNANVQQGTGSTRSEDELSTTDPEISADVLASDGNRDNILQISDQFKQDFLW